MRLVDLNKAKWLVFLEEKSVKDVFETVYIPFDCDFLVAQGPMGDSEVSLLEVYHVVPEGSLQINRIGAWRYSQGFTWSSSSYFKRRGNLHGVTIKAAVYPQVRSFSKLSKVFPCKYVFSSIR
jgi:hypothetical protein